MGLALLYDPERLGLVGHIPDDESGPRMFHFVVPGDYNDSEWTAPESYGAGTGGTAER